MVYPQNHCVWSTCYQSNNAPYSFRIHCYCNGSKWCHCTVSPHSCNKKRNRRLSAALHCPLFLCLYWWSCNFWHTSSLGAADCVMEMSQRPIEKDVGILESLYCTVWELETYPCPCGLLFEIHLAISTRNINLNYI